MAYTRRNPNGQTTMANSTPVTISNDQSSVNTTFQGIIGPQTVFSLTTVGNTIQSSVTPGVRYSICLQVPVMISGGTFEVIFEISNNGSTWTTLTTSYQKSIIANNAINTSGTATDIGLWQFIADSTTRFVRVRLTAIATIAGINAFIDDISVPGAVVNLPYIAGLTGFQASGGSFIPPVEVSGLGPISVDISGFAGTSQIITWQQSSESNFGTSQGAPHIIGGTATPTVALTATGAGLYNINPTAKYFRAQLTYTTITSMTIGGVTAQVVNPTTYLQMNSSNIYQIAGGTATTSQTGTLAIGLAASIANADRASGAATTSGSQTAATQGNVVSSSWVIGVTAVTGTTPTMDLVLQESLDGGTTWYDRYHIQRITATTQIATPVITFRGNRYRWVWTIAGTSPSFTFSINALRYMTPTDPTFAFYDRAAVLTTLNSTSAVWDVQGAKNHLFSCTIGAATTPPVIALDLSNDGTNFFEAQSLTAVASSTIYNIVANHPAKFARLRVKTAGATVTANHLSYISTD